MGRVLMLVPVVRHKPFSSGRNSLQLLRVNFRLKSFVLSSREAVRHLPPVALRCPIQLFLPRLGLVLLHNALGSRKTCRWLLGSIRLTRKTLRLIVALLRVFTGKMFPFSPRIKVRRFRWHWPSNKRALHFRWQTNRHSTRQANSVLTRPTNRLVSTRNH